MWVFIYFLILLYFALKTYFKLYSITYFFLFFYYYYARKEYQELFLMYSLSIWGWF